jgi:hypothetical protein
MTAPNDVFKTTISETVATGLYEVEKLKRIVQLLDTWEREEQKK